MTFKSHQDAVSAYEALDRKSFQGRLMHILAAVDRRNKYEVEEGEGRKKSLKEDRQAKKKSAAGKEFNWSMLYMNVRDGFPLVDIVFAHLTRRVMQLLRPSPTAWASPKLIYWAALTLAQILPSNSPLQKPMSSKRPRITLNLKAFCSLRLVLADDLRRQYS